MGGRVKNEGASVPKTLSVMPLGRFFGFNFFADSQMYINIQIVGYNKSHKVMNELSL